jgi:HTH-type transcriptional regulator/antitoxin MqsA
MAKNPRNYPDTIPSPETGRTMSRGEKLVSLKVGGRVFHYRQPGWWCSLDDPHDLEGQLVDDDNLVAEMARRTAEAMVSGESFTPLLIRAIRIRCGLSQREAGEVFGTGEKSFEKYESGQIRPSEPTKRLLWLAMRRPELFSKKNRDSLRMAAVPDNESIERTLRETQLDRLYAPMFEQ